MKLDNLVVGAYYKIKYNFGNRDDDFRNDDRVKFIKVVDIGEEYTNGFDYTLVSENFVFVDDGNSTFKAGDIDHQVSPDAPSESPSMPRKSVAVNTLRTATPRKRSFMKKLSAVARKVLDKDIRTLVKGGVLSDDLTINDPSELLELLVMANKADLAKIVTDRLAEEKEDRKSR